MIRPANVRDLDALVALENASFKGDRITRRSFGNLLRGRSSVILADFERGVLRGYVLLFFRAGTRVGRLYSVAVAAAARGHGVGRKLVRAAERETSRRRRDVLRLEIRKDNAASLALFRGAGYTEFGETAGYYEDGIAALRFEKALRRAA